MKTPNLMMYGDAVRVVEIADKAYPDDCVSLVDASRGEKVGDELAEFIAHEIADVCNHAKNYQQALTCSFEAMDRAIEELTAVRDAIEKEIEIED
jgi:hypothetical protein